MAQSPHIWSKPCIQWRRLCIKYVSIQLRLWMTCFFHWRRKHHIHLKCSLHLLGSWINEFDEWGICTGTTPIPAGREPMSTRSQARFNLILFKASLEICALGKTLPVRQMAFDLRRLYLPIPVQTSDYLCTSIRITNQCCLHNHTAKYRFVSSAYWTSPTTIYS